MTCSPNIFIATPMYNGMCHAGYVKGLLALNKTFIQHGWSFCYRHTTNESLINRARNNLTHSFLNQEKESTHLLFIDADIGGFDGKDICEMIEADVDIVAGVYPMKHIDPLIVKDRVLNNIEEEKILTNVSPLVFNSIADSVSITSPKKLEQVSNAGTGFMLIKREVFEKISLTVPRYINNSIGFEDETTCCFFDTSIDSTNGTLLSEDYHFCKLWTDIGGKIYIAPWVKLTHAGTHIFN